MMRANHDAVTYGWIPYGYGWLVMGQTESGCEWGSGYPRCIAMPCPSMPAHSALRCAVDCGLRTTYCTWRSANASRSRARLGHFCEDRLDRTGHSGTNEDVEASKSVCRVHTVIPSNPIPLSISSRPIHHLIPPVHSSIQSVHVLHSPHSQRKPHGPLHPSLRGCPPSISSGCCSNFLAVPDCLIPIRVKR
ncbi:hypothetical protein Landi51_12488 [Colletotrichum acutatum]